MTSPGRRWRRRGLTFAATGVLLASTVSCSSDDGVEWWHISNTDPLLSVWAELAEEYESQNEGVTFNITPLENEAFKSRMATITQPSDMPDLFQSWGGGVLAQQVDAGLVRDITDDVAPWIDQLSPGAILAYEIDGRIYGVAWDTGMVGFWYNKALFAEAGIDGVPETWDEFLDAVRALKAADITPIALGGAEEWPGHYWWTYLAMRTAGLEGLQEAAENRSIESEDFVWAGELLADLVALDPFQPGFEGAGFGGPDGQSGFMARGEAAMELMGQWAPDAQSGAAAEEAAIEAGIDVEAEDAEIPELDEHPLGDDLGFFKFPAVEGGNGNITEIMGGGNGIAVSSQAPDEAVDFLRFLFETESQRAVVGVGGAVPVAADPTTVIEDELDPNLAMVLDTLEEGTGFQLYLDQDYPPAVGGQVNNSVAALMVGAATPEDVVEAVTRVWQREAE